ncbi:RecQ family ATP-dependent DNA helicase [Vibrio sp. 99-70-13A1]|uniref:RecQ family ATP-dependent DNA helicase n=1 Tax=Vibrio sp. 99-70-13A1 TaxID=2607601 RepID=UPI001493D4AD|nr:RecQ family ATP-dependent DNA helicase [Vibrio sp. 99-70-13A1]NOH98002.1 RecQ family ATP-dependent DNA helicase [Vibrio sp. 99-70-13A1]
MIEQTLKQVFGFDSLRYGQKQVIDNVLEGNSTAAIFPTGSGKSLCYQLPALELPHLTLVISPLLALMKDQLAFLHSKGINAAAIESSQNRQTTQHVMQAVRNGETKILMISVERLKNERFRQFISQVPISLLVVDEAHCISEWGHNFRPDYLKLPHYQRQLNISQVLLLTATATSSVIEDMKSKFSIDEKNVVVTGFYRPNLDLSIQPCTEPVKLETLCDVVNKAAQLPTIVYVTLQQTAEGVAQQLRNVGINAIAYHAGLKPEVRDSIQKQFMNDDIHCIVATIAFGMGVDKSNIRRVIHFDLPKSIENYSQEIGRAGRDGERSECILLANKNGLSTLENFVYGDTPDNIAIHSVLEQIYQHEQQWETMLNQLSRETNIRQLPLKTLLVYLELAGVIEPKYSFFADYRFKFIRSKDQILNKFHGERRDFVETIFQCSPQARVWCQIDFETLWNHFQADRQRVIAAMDYFHEQGWIELESKQITDVYAVKNTTLDIHTQSEQLTELFKIKENNEVERLAQMLNFFEADTCLSSRLASYFADDKAPTQCGHCSVCRGDIASLPGHLVDPIDEEIAQQWISEFLANATQLITDEAIARFLSGIATPLSTKMKASKMMGYGKLEQYPFSKTLQLVQRLERI